MKILADKFRQITKPFREFDLNGYMCKSFGIMFVMFYASSSVWYHFNVKSVDISLAHSKLASSDL